MSDISRQLSGPLSMVERLLLPLNGMRHRLGLLRWMIPVTLVLLVAGYELGPARWVYDTYGFRVHLLLEILVFGTVGPALLYAMLDLLWRWLDERDTSDFQSQLLKQTRGEAERSRLLVDDALQTLYAAGMLLTVCRSDRPPLPPETEARVESAEQALDEAMQRLRVHLND